ncbi:carboxylesterase family protein [Nonomuraea sp. NPDC004186]
MTWLFSSSVRYIPYAAPPTGALRRQPPQPPSAWKDVKDGSRAAPRCPQNGNPADSNPVGTAEDCLYLNVTAPRTASGRRLPVMVWLHGGGFTQGSGGDNDARRLARPGAVVVTVNYRLGVFGFLGHPGLAGSGAFGLLDQQAALRWVRHNAAAFGGDPHNVTLFGESAGAFSTCAQLTSPAATGLFDKAITQSGGCSMRQLGIDPAGGDTIWPSRQAGERIAAPVAAPVAEPVACTDATRTMPCLRRVPTSRLLTAQQRVPATWAPSNGTDTLPQEPGSSLRTAFGRAAKRVSARYPAGAHGSPSLAWAAIATDRGWTCPTLAGNRLLARKTAVYQYADAPGRPGDSPACPWGRSRTRRCGWQGCRRSA